MTAAWRGANATAATASVLSVAVTLPAGIANGDIGYIAHTYNPTTGATTTPAGWTLVRTDAFSATAETKLFRKSLVTGDSGATVTFTNAGSQRMSAAAGVLTGVSAEDVVNVRVENVTTPATNTAPTATATASDVQMVFWTERSSTPATAMTTAPSGVTIAASAFGTGSGACSAVVGYNLTPVAAAGTLGGGVWDPDVSNNAVIMYVIGVTVAAAGVAVAPDNAEQLQTASAPTVTHTPPNYSIVPDAAEQLQTASAPTVTATAPNYSIAPANAAQAQAADAPTVTFHAPPVTWEPRSPFLIEVWDGTTVPFTRKGRVGSYVASEVVLRHNQVGSWKFTLSLSDGGVDLLTPPGRRITIDYRGTRILSGPAFGIRRARSGREDEVEVYGYSDLIWLDRRLAFPDPLATFPADGVAFTQPVFGDSVSDNAESAVKYWVGRNCVTRLPVPTLTVAADLGRGPVKGDAPRFKTVLETCAKLADLSSIGLSLEQVDDGLVFDIYEPAEQPVRLSRSLGNLRDWEFINEGPKKTRTVIGGPGGRLTREFTLGKVPSSETGWGITESFIESSADTHAERYQEGLDDLEENVPTYSFSVTPQDTEAMRFGETYHLGDTVATELFPTVTLTDIVRQVTITDSVDEGVDVKPIVGNLEAAKRADAVYQELRKLRARINKREREI